MKSDVIGGDGDCTILTAAVTHNGANPEFPAVSDTYGIRDHPSKRRPASNFEIKILRRLASQWLNEYGLDNSLIVNGFFGPVTAAPLRRVGGG